MRFKSVLFITFLVMLLTLLGCGKDKGANEEGKSRLDNLNTESEMPIVKDQIKLNIFANQAPTTADDWNDIMIFNEYEKMTNIDVEWQMVPLKAWRRNEILF